jgi:hypothetical protein
MSITQNKKRAKTDYDMTYEAGYNEASLAHWNAITNNGKRTVWNDYSPFSYTDYSTVEFPKPIVLTGDISRLFRLYQGAKFPRKIDIDMTGVTNATDTFSFIYSTGQRVLPDYGIPALDIYDCTYRSSSAIYEIELLRCRENTQFTKTFDGCTGLVNLIVEGTIGQNGFNVKDSPKLSKASIYSIIYALATNPDLAVNNPTVTLSKAAVDKAFESPSGANNGSTSLEWAVLSEEKGAWTKVLA